MCLYGGVFVVLLVNFLDMARRVRDFRTHEELSEYVNTISWSDSEEDGDFSSDNSELDPDFDFEAAFRNERRLDDEEGDEVVEAADAENIKNDAADDMAVVEIGNNVASSSHIVVNVEPNAGNY